MIFNTFFINLLSTFKKLLVIEHMILEKIINLS